MGGRAGGCLELGTLGWILGGLCRGLGLDIGLGGLGGRREVFFWGGGLWVWGAQGSGGAGKGAAGFGIGWGGQR